MKTEIAQRLTVLRGLMAKAGVNAAIINKTDPHQSEYIGAHWAFLRRISGFTGSAATMVVTADKALLWTDSRYFIQAAQQLDGTEIRLIKEGLPETPDIPTWLTHNLTQGSTVGVDGMLFSRTEADGLAATLGARGIELKTDFDPIADTWPDRPALPQDKVFVHDIRYAGQSAADKIAALLTAAADLGADAIFTSALDEIVWTLNIRAHDVPYTTVVTSFLYLSPKGNTLFVDENKLDEAVRAHLAEAGVSVAGYGDVLPFIAALPTDVRVLAQPDKNAVAVTNALGARAVLATSPAGMLKAVKNKVQLAGVRAAMERDGVALVSALMEIERHIDNDLPLTELDVVRIFRQARQAQALFFDESFGTIAGFGAHGAIVHYDPTEESNAEIHRGSLLLIDSGAQYLDGTTDITRTIAIGESTAEQRHDFTLVMKGHIALATAVFPQGTVGMQLDILARQFLWKQGLTYLHGTGHGVGHFLNVHEGPQSIRLNYVPAPMAPGMITSNEPGLYRENVHGIRCENLVLTTEAMTTEFGKFYRFETLTLCPFDLSLFDVDMMTDAEIEWVNDYHRMVCSRLTPMLNSAQRTWLEKKTRPLTRN